MMWIGPWRAGMVAAAALALMGADALERGPKVKPDLQPTLEKTVQPPGGAPGALRSEEHAKAVEGTAEVSLPAFDAAGPKLDVVKERRPDPRLRQRSLDELMVLYRKSLVEMAHPFSKELANNYADVQVESVKNQFANDEKGLRTFLIARLTEPRLRPGKGDIAQKGPVYPADPQDKTFGTEGLP